MRKIGTSKYAFRDDPLVAGDTDNILCDNAVDEGARVDVFMNHLVNDYHLVGRHRAYCERNGVPHTLGVIRSLYRSIILDGEDQVTEKQFVDAVDTVMSRHLILSRRSIENMILAQKKQCGGRRA